MGMLKELEAKFDYDIVDEFMDHFEIMCNAMEPVINRVREEENIPECIEEIFRVAHNLKSAAGFLELQVLHKFATFIEDNLEHIRKRDTAFGEETIDWFYLISDQLNDWYEDLKNDAEEFRKIRIEIFDIPQEIDAS
jgi:two-component system chemotaxis sensor kinase CheA